MKRILVIVVLAMAVPSLTFGQATEKKTASSSKSKAARSNKRASADEAAIRKLQDDIVAAFNAADLDRLMSFHTDDVIYLAPGKPVIEGWKAVRADFQAIFEGWTQRRVIAKLEAQSPHEVVVCGAWAFARGQSTLTFTSKDGSTPTQVFAKFISIYRRQPDGSWKRCRQIRNGDRPQDNI